MRPSRLLLVLAILLVIENDGVVGQSNDTVWKGFSVTCNNDDKGEVTNVSVSCHGIRLVRKIVQKLLEEAKRKRSLEIVDGVSLVQKDEEEGFNRGARVLKESGQTSTVMSFLENRELRIKLPSFLPANLEDAIEGSLPSAEQAKGRGGGGGGGGGGFGGGKGGNGMMMMALMMGKTMAAMGFGALALLAMKALMVSSLALMLSLIVAAKKLASSKEDDSHHVVYAQEVSSHHRRRRSLGSKHDHLKNQPYRGYINLPTEM
ncbi:uncharacterized protein LOC103317766 [Nasonia vitripennis]|uniref:Uncharacterized protein n=1 Tax=Nasonia vitripennis TaxID=7425 RepID=A0A7M7LRZ7_NASVI|nr:uncharacterized protein LOC103317766 [Nasonia vitripennis]